MALLKKPFPTRLAGLCTATMGFWNITEVTIIKASVRSELNHAEQCGLRGAAISAPLLELGRTLVLLWKLMNKKSIF